MTNRLTPARRAAWARAAVAAVFSNRNPLPGRQTLSASELTSESRRPPRKGQPVDGPSQVTNDRTRAIREKIGWTAHQNTDPISEARSSRTKYCPTKSGCPGERDDRLIHMITGFAWHCSPNGSSVRIRLSVWNPVRMDIIQPLQPTFPALRPSPDPRRPYRRGSPERAVPVRSQD